MKLPPERYNEAAYDRFLDQAWTNDFGTHPPAEGSLLECVIVEPRCHPRLARVLRNMSCVLPNAALTVVGSAQNRSMVEEIVGAGTGTGTNVRFLDCGADNLTMREYSALLTSPGFYERLCGEHILVFQTDTGIRRNEVLRFLEYDYVGAPWDHVIIRNPRLRMGNGGFSLRRRTKMLEMVTRHRPDHAANEMVPGYGEPEDVFLVRCLYADAGAVLPTPQVANTFSVEATWCPCPMGFHQAHMFWEGAQLEQLLFEGTDLPGPEYVPARRVRVTDAWLEEEGEGGTVISHDPVLCAWLSLAVGPHGLRIPYGCRLPLRCKPEPPPASPQLTLRLWYTDSAGQSHEETMSVDADTWRT